MAERREIGSKISAGSPSGCSHNDVDNCCNGESDQKFPQQIQPSEQQQQQNLILDTVARELLELNETLIRENETNKGQVVVGVRSKTPPIARAAFPPGCMNLLHNLPGNSQCVDCGASNPTWASISYGILLCLHCSGRHRHFGVNHSKVRSVIMDSWENPTHVLCMLEGGNDQWKTFLQRHDLDPHLNIGNGTKRPEGKGVYQTKAALFYRENLQKHVQKVMSAGTYEGRHVWRDNRQQKKVRSRPTTPKRQPD